MTTGHRHEWGGISLILGPMMCGKSTELHRRVRRLRVAKVSCCVISHCANERDGLTHSRTHDDFTLDLSGSFNSMEEFYTTYYTEALATPKPIQVVAIDEGQLFHDIEPWVTRLANEGVSVIIAACDRLVTGKPFGAVSQLVHNAEDILKLKAICALCQADNAIFAQRRDIPLRQQFDPEESARLSVVVTGGASLYMSVCQKCLVNRLQIEKEELNGTRSW